MTTRPLDGGRGASVVQALYAPDHNITYSPSPYWAYPGLGPSGNLARVIEDDVTLPAVQYGFEAKSDESSAVDHTCWKPFEHYKVFLEPRPNSQLDEVRLVSGEWTNSPYFHTAKLRDPWLFVDAASYGGLGRSNSGLRSYYTVRSDGGFVPPPDDLDSLLSKAYKVLLPGIKSDLSLVNSIIELKDFKSLPSAITKIVKGFSRIRVLTAKSGWNTKTLKHLANQYLHGGSDVYLQSQFNILPLLSDIAALRAALSRSERQMSDLITRQGKVQSRHFSYNWFEESYDEDQSATFSTNYGNRLCTVYRKVVPENARFHVQMQYNFNFTAFQIEHARLLSYLDVLGVNFNPTIIWNAIPWSFVIDWVFGIGRFLDQFKAGNMTPTINIHRALWSITRRRRIGLRRQLSSKPAAMVSFSEVTLLPETNESTYRRSVFVPSSSSIQSSGLNIKEFSLGAALVISRRRRYNRKQQG